MLNNTCCDLRQRTLVLHLGVLLWHWVDEVLVLHSQVICHVRMHLLAVEARRHIALRHEVSVSLSSTACTLGIRSGVASVERLSCTIHHVVRERLANRLAGDTVREKGFVDFKQSFFVVHEQIKQMALVSTCEIGNFYPVLCQLCKS